MLGIEFEDSKFLGRLFGQKRKEAKEKAMEMLKAVGLADSANKYPSELVITSYSIHYTKLYESQMVHGFYLQQIPGTFRSQ